MKLKSFFNFMFEYETQKVVQINSRKIGAFFRFIQASILVYLIGWVMYYERGYQASDQAISGVTAKLKGVSFINVTKEIPAIGTRIFDVADYMVPPQQNSAFFIMTNMVVSSNQKQGVCPESHDVYKIKCKTDSDCVFGDYVMLGSGMKTGRCVQSDQVAKMNVCEIYGWCPAEHDTLVLSHPIITNAANFTVLLKNSIEFPKFHVRRRNILKWMTKKFLYKCNYVQDHPEKKYCPIFRLGDILKYAKADTPDIWYKGGMVTIDIIWNCDLDFSEEHCLPKYEFRRIDEPNSPVGKGWNFRYGNYYMVNGVEYRDLIKAYGIQFFITVHGKAYQFDLYTVTMNIGSGVGLFGVATLLCDMLIFNLVKHRSVYRSATTDIASTKQPKRSITVCQNCVCCKNNPVVQLSGEVSIDVVADEEFDKHLQEVT